MIKRKGLLVFIAMVICKCMIGQTLVDSDYYIYLNGSIVDIRSGETKFDNATYGETRFISPTEFLVLKKSYGPSQLVKHNLITRKQKIIQIPGWLSSNWNYCLSVEDGEIYRANIDWPSGTFINKTKLTDLKAFNGASFANSFENWVFVAPKGYQSQLYLLNTKTKEMISTDYNKIGNNMDMTLFSSPSRRYVYQHQRNDITKIYDVSLNKYLDLNFIPSEGQRVTSYVWIDNNTFFFFFLKKYLGGGKKGMVHLQVVDCLNLENSYSKEFRKIIGGSPWLDFQFGVNGSGTHNSNMVFFQSLYGNDANTDVREYQKYLFNIAKENLAEPREWDENIGIVKSKNPIDYLHGNLLTYRKSGDLLNQGSYLYNPELNTNLKISKYVYDNIFQVGKTEYIMFSVNEDVYSYNIESNETKEVATKVRVDKGFYYLK